MISLRLLAMDNEGNSHERFAATIFRELQLIGGLLSIVILSSRMMNQIIGKPFRDLYLGIKYD